MSTESFERERIGPFTTIRGALVRAARIYFENLRGIALIILVVYGPAVAIDHFIFESFLAGNSSIGEVNRDLSRVAWETILSPLWSALSIPPLIYLVTQPLKARDALQKGASKWGKALAVVLLSSLVVLALLPWLIVPAVVAAIRFAFVLQVVCLEEQRSSIAVLRRSAALTRDRGWALFGAMVVAVVILVVPHAILDFGVNVMGYDDVVAVKVATRLIGEIANAYATVLFVVIYLGIVGHESHRHALVEHSAQ